MFAFPGNGCVRVCVVVVIRVVIVGVSTRLGSRYAGVVAYLYHAYRWHSLLDGSEVIHVVGVGVGVCGCWLSLCVCLLLSVLLPFVFLVL